jgi:succinyl-CoA synthetase beta subunit
VARLHEYQGKALLKQHGIAVPRGEVVKSPGEAREAARRLLVNSDKVIMKVQAWTTSRTAKGGVMFASTVDEAASHAERLLSMRFGNFPVTEILIEEAIDIRDEIFVSISIDDAVRAPVMLLDCAGGSGIEERATSVARVPIEVKFGARDDDIRRTFAASRIDKSLHEQLVKTIQTLAAMAKQYEARSLEINPLVIARKKGSDPFSVFAADCRMTIDDYAVFRHPELGIEIARELDHPPTELERIAYKIEEADHRGTFYFAQLPTDSAKTSKGLIGFHGAGGGGSMMSMDAATAAGFTLANFCDTSGNPSAAKVYRAARIILSQPDLVGYFGSGSGVASQEQFWSSYGLAKAFVELNLDIPAVIRLGGNSEDRAVAILTSTCRGLPAPVEGYKKDDSPAKCAARFAALVEGNGGRQWKPRDRQVPAFVGRSYWFPINEGRVWIDHSSCDAVLTEFIVNNSSWLLKADERGTPVLAVSEREVANKDSEMIMLEIECRRRTGGTPIVFVDLPVIGIDAPAPNAHGVHAVGAAVNY